jgi:hypothetical protein
MKLGKIELQRRISVSKNTHVLMTVLQEHLNKDCSDAEKLATIQAFCSGNYAAANMDQQHLTIKLRELVA